MSKEKPEVVFGEYAVGIIDVLNQRDKLRQWVRPRDTEGMKKLVGVLRETWGPVSQFREAVQKILGDFAKKMNGPVQAELMPLFRQLTAEQQIELQKLRPVEFGIMHYSDTIIVHSRMFNLENEPQLSGLYLFIHALGGLMLSALAGGVAIRGAIEVGLAGPFPEGDIYGPAIVLAHDLEAQIAQYPRIVIGKQAMEFLDDVQKHGSKAPAEQIAKATAEDCRRMIRPDPVDGWPIVDYLGPGFNVLKESSLHAAAVAAATQFAEGQYQKFVNANDIKLAPRYKRLVSYLRKSASSPQSV